ncbi:MAG: HAD family phosphatase, partial [Lachnospiraceae bacterium]|nr:HAD family phosphatase [Lachnospiraceae bacterium]
KLEPGIFTLIRELTQKGIYFAAASGRQYTNLRRLFAPVQDEIIYLCENGFLAFYKEELIFKEEMPREDGSELIRAVLEKDGCEALLSGVYNCYLQPKKDSYVDWMENVVGNDCSVVEDLTAVEEPFLKVSIYEEDGVKDAAEWQERFSDRFNVVTSGNAWMDIMPKYIHKGYGLKKILDRLNILPGECAAFGDNENDREMLELVGLPITMDTSSESVYDLGRYHTDTVENMLDKMLHKKGGLEI